MATKKETAAAEDAALTPEAEATTGYQPTADDLVLPDGTILLDGNGTVPLHIPTIPGQKDQPDVVISVNGRNYQIQRGHTVMVPRAVYEIYMNSDQLKESANRYYYENAN